MPDPSPALPDNLPERPTLVTQSPCIKLCRIDPDSRLCLGCHRTLDEIAAWGRMTPAARARVMADLSARQETSDMPRLGS